jgi:hypothetical protein
MTKEEQKARKVELQRIRRAAMSEEEKTNARIRAKACRDANKQKNMIRDKVYRDTHKEEKAAWSKDYKQTPAGRKAKSLSNWKGRGIICDDWDALYEKYLTTLLCEQCNVELTTDRYNTETTRTLDHNHDTHLFRNVLCHSCNIRRDVRRKARSAAGRCRIELRTDLSC